MPHEFQSPVLLATQEQWRVAAQQAGIAGLTSIVQQQVRGTWAQLFGPYPWESNSIQIYSSTGDSFDLEHGTATPAVYAVATEQISGAINVPTVSPTPSLPVASVGESPNLPPGDQPDAPIPELPGTQTPGVLASMLPSSSGGTMTQLAPTIVGGLMRFILPALSAARSTGGRLGGSLLPTSFRDLLSKVLGVLGISQVLDIVLPSGGGEGDALLIEAFIKCIDEMEKAGVIHPWTSRNPEDTGPKYLILNLIDGQGFYTNFHMSRSGLKAHDDDQDTVRRTRRAPRTNRPTTSRRGTGGR